MSMTDELLQSEAWMRFQGAAGKRTVLLSGRDWSAGGVVHRLPLVGEYLYIPRGPRGRIGDRESGIMQEATGALLEKAKRMRIGWIRIEPETEKALSEIRGAAKGKRIVKAPHDMQPREIFRVGLAPSEEELLAAMKSKTRYNIRIAEKRGVRVIATIEPKYRDAFIHLVTGTADRKGIVPHPKAYYEAMCATLLGENGSIFAAEKDGEIVAANLVVFHGDTATYLHGGSDERFRADMAPFLLQWEAMCEAKRRGCSWYDFGGVSTREFSEGSGKWLGITRFKFGFSPATGATVFPGAYDIVLSPSRYFLYTVIQGARGFLSGIVK